MPREGSPGQATPPEAAEIRTSMRRRMANFFIGPAEEVMRRDVRQGRITAEAANQLLREQAKAQLKKIVAPIVFSGKAVGGTLLAGPLIGGAGIGLLYKTGKVGWDISSTAYKSKNFFDTTTNEFKLMWSKMGIGKKK